MLFDFSKQFFIRVKFVTPDLAFGQLNEQFIRDYQDFILLEKGYAVDTLRGYLAILKKICRIAYKEGHSEKYHFCHFKLPKQKETTPKALSRENFEKLRDLEIPEKRRSHIITKDLFLFACYTGTAYADAVSITRDDKAEFVRELQMQGKKVAMVGDGINDSQALALADVSIAMGKGTDIAMDVAMVTLMTSDLLLLPKAFQLSKQTVKLIHQNLFWAFIYNLIGIPIAARKQHPPLFRLLLKKQVRISNGCNKR